MKSRITLIGLGRLGASIGLALKNSGAELEIIGHDKLRDVGNAAHKAGAVDKHDWNLYNACEGAGLIVMAMPLAGVLESIELLKDDIAPGVIVTDTTSVKAPVLRAARAFKPGVHFIGGHPIFRPAPDGTPTAAQAAADLFQNAHYCLTPTPDADADALQVLTGFVALLGAKPFFIDPVEHDGLVAGAQHLALALEAALLKTTALSSGWRELNRFAGADYFNATLLAAREAKSTAQLVHAQRAPLQMWLDQTIQTLRELKGLLAQAEPAALEEWLTAAQTARAQWLTNQVGAAAPTVDLSEVRAGTARMFLGGLATRRGGDKKK